MAQCGPDVANIPRVGDSPRCADMIDLVHNHSLVDDVHRRPMMEENVIYSPNILYRGRRARACRRFSSRRMNITVVNAESEYL